MIAERSKQTVLEFLDHFLPEREEVSQVYEVPRFGKTTTAEFHTAADLMGYLETHPNEPYAVYWRSLNNKEIRMADAHFTNDGFLILGLASCAEDKLENKLLTRLKEYAGTNEGYITYEQPPPLNAAAFREIVNTKN